MVLMPRYVMCWLAMARGDRCFHLLERWGCNGRISLLSKLILNPEQSLKSEKSCLSLSKSVMGSVENNSMSSANSAERRVWFSRVMPLIPSAEFSILDRGSIARLNRSGDRGHPCLVPFVNGIVSEIKSGVTRRAVGDAYICERNRIIGPENPNCVITLKSQEKLILSKAFSASNDMMAMSWLG